MVIWASDRIIWLLTSHIPGKVDCDADCESRHFQMEHEWMLDKKKFYKLLSIN